MGQELVLKPYDGQTLTTGGIRLLVREKPVSGPTKGYGFVGKIHTPTFEPSVEFLEHFSAESGAQVKDSEVPIKTGYKIGFTADELLLANFRRFLFAGAPEDQAADAEATAGPETFIAGRTGDLHGLEFGRQTEAQRGDLVVYNVTETAALVEDTDYEVIAIHGWTFIRMLVDTHEGDQIKVGTSAEAADPYEHVEAAAKVVTPMTALRLEVAAILQGPAKRGVNFEWRIPSALIKPDGEFNLSAEEYSSMKFALEALDDSANDPDAPFGTFAFYGIDTDGNNII